MVSSHPLIYGTFLILLIAALLPSNEAVECKEFSVCAPYVNYDSKEVRGIIII